MKLHNILLVLLGAVACSADYTPYSPLSYVDRPCGSDLANLWLDVIAVVDNSQGMTNDGLSSVAANIVSVFASNNTRIGTNTTEPRTTRLGLVTYNSGGSVNADLNAFQSIDDVFNNVFNALSATVDTSESFLSFGLNAAEQLFKDQSSGTARDHYRKVVIVYASEYKGFGSKDPLPVASRLKLSGVNIITVAYDQGGDESLLNDLSNIATEGMNFTNDDGVIEQIQKALAQSNCFCRNDWLHYRVSYTDADSYHYGICIQPVNLNAVWRAAKIACNTRWPRSYLASEFSQHKHDFILQAVKEFGIPIPYKYFIGLTFVNGAWVWDQPTGQPQPALQQWYNWIQGYPISSSSMSVAKNTQSGLGTGWQNVGSMNTQANYICEAYSCDTDIYCDSNWNKNQ